MLINKVLAIFLLLCLCIGMCACSGTLPISSEESQQPMNNEEAEQPEAVNHLLRLIEYNSDGCIRSDTSFILVGDYVKEDEKMEYNYNSQGLLANSILFCDGEQSGTEYERFEYDSSGRILNIFHYGTLTHEYQYDSDGQCIKERITDSEKSSTITYTYQNGIIATSYEESFALAETEDGFCSIGGYCFTEYDDQGKITKESVYEWDELPYVNIYQYSENSLDVKSYDLLGNLIRTRTMRYDDSDRLIYKNCSDLIYEWSWTNQYEYSDNSMKKSHYDSDGALESSYYYIWDDRNNIILEESCDAAENVINTWQYEYDDNCQVRRIVQTIDGQESIKYGPEREYYEDGTIKSIAVYANVDYIPPLYFADPPKFHPESKYT